MSAPSAPAVRPRPQGGFNQGLGQFSEHLDEEAMHNAVQQKALAQQGTMSSQPTTGGSALGQHHQPGTAAAPGGAGNPAHAPQPAPPREVSTIPDELIKRPAQDVVAGLKSFFDINRLLEIHPESDDPATQAKKKEFAHNYERLKADEQKVFREKYQQRMEEKQREEQAKEARKQQEAQKRAQTINVPSGPNKGPVGPGGQKKPAAVTKMEQDRKTLGGPQAVG